MIFALIIRTLYGGTLHNTQWLNFYKLTFYGIFCFFRVINCYDNVLLHVEITKSNEKDVLVFLSKSTFFYCLRTKLTSLLYAEMPEQVQCAVSLNSFAFIYLACRRRQGRRSFAYVGATVGGSSPATAHIGRPHSLWTVDLGSLIYFSHFQANWYKSTVSGSGPSQPQLE